MAIALLTGWLAGCGGGSSNAASDSSSSSSGGGAGASSSSGGASTSSGASLYTVGGTVSGLGNESGLVLTKNGADATVIAPNVTTFSMTSALPSGAAYSIAIKHHPPGVHCDISIGSGSHGNLYGTTYTGGTSDEGMVFRLALDGTETILYSFTPSDNARWLWSGVIEAPNGDLIGTSWAGGMAGTVYKLY